VTETLTNDNGLALFTPLMVGQTLPDAPSLTNTNPLTYAFAGSEGQRVSFYQKPRSLGVELSCAF
jgi:hypothetical protein